MGIALDIIGQTKVDDMRQVVHIQSSSCHIGSHKKLCEVLAEFLHGEVALLLRQVAMQRLCIIAVANQFICYLLRLQFGTAEDNGENLGIIVNDTLQGQILILGLHHIIYMIHALGTLVARTYHHLFVVSQVFLGHALYLAAHCSREHQRAVLLGERLENLVDSLREAHIQHFIGLIEYDIAYILQFGIATIFQVNKSARGGHNHLSTLFQGTNLLFDSSTAIDGLHMNALHIFREIAQIIGNL